MKRRGTPFPVDEIDGLVDALPAPAGLIAALIGLAGLDMTTVFRLRVEHYRSDEQIFQVGHIRYDIPARFQEELRALIADRPARGEVFGHVKTRWFQHLLTRHGTSARSLKAGFIVGEFRKGVDPEAVARCLGMDVQAMRVRYREFCKSGGRVPAPRRVPGGYDKTREINRKKSPPKTLAGPDPEVIRRVRNHYISPQSFERVLDPIRHKPAALIAGLVYYGGLREREALALRPVDLDFENQSISIPGRHERSVNIPGEILHTLMWQAEDASPSGWLFPGRCGTEAYKPRSFHTVLSRAGHLGNLNNFNSKSFRISSGINRLLAGMAPPDVARELGIRELTVAKYRKMADRVGLRRKERTRETLAPLEAGQACALLGDDRWSLMVALIYSTGIRAAEALRLQICDVNTRTRSIRVSGRHERRVYYPREISFMMKQATRARPAADYLFPSRRVPGKPASLRGFSGALQRVSRKSEIPVSAENLRASFVANVLAAGVAPMSIHKALGNSTGQINRSSIVRHVQRRVGG